MTSPTMRQQEIPDQTRRTEATAQDTSAPGDTRVSVEQSGVGVNPLASPKESALTVVLGTLFWGAVVVWVALANDTTRQFLEDNWTWLTATGTGVLVVLVVVAVRGRISRSGAAMKAALVLIIGLPVLGLLVLSVTALPAQAQLLTLRSVFLVLVIFTPTLMWWLFVAAQRQSLLNEFLANLDRLGLLEPEDPRSGTESVESRRTRVSAYLQKFEANFVRVPKPVYDAVTEGDMLPYPREEETPGAPLATTAVPVFLTLVTLAVGWILTLPPTEMSIGDSQPMWLDALAPNPTPVTMAFLGAYFFSLQMIFRRYVRRDLRGSAYVAVVMRVILAVIGTWVVTEVAAGGGWERGTWQLLTIGFVIGMFPKVAWQIVQSLFAKLTRRALPSMEARLPLSELDGLTVWHEARLEEEDIENVPNMATADLVELLVSTRYAPDRLIDWVDQAILLTHLGPDQAMSQRRRASRRKQRQQRDPTSRDRLAAHGIRNASSLLQAAKDAERRGVRDQFDKVVVDLSGDPAVPSLLVAVTTNCNLGRVLRWRGIEQAGS